MRVVRSLLALALMGFVCAACDGLSIKTAKRTAADTGTVEDTGGSETGTGDDTALETGAEDTGVDTATDTATDTAVDTAPDTAADTVSDTAVDTRDDTAADTTSDSIPPTGVDCASIPIAATSGESCDQAAPVCATGAACIGLGTGLGAECLQVCTPTECSDICGAQGICSGLVDLNDNPLLQDLDGNGTEEEVGACFPVVQAFSLCGTPTTGGCADGQICVGDATAANCTPTCATPGATCGTFNGVEALCNLTLQAADGTEQPACSIDCATAADCPTGLSCVPITGGRICLERPLAALGTACTANVECASGNCATGPTGTANDRCAPTGMNFIPSGTFTMGSPTTEPGRGTDETQHSVTISRGFFMGQTEVTQGQWKLLSGGINPSYFQNTTCTYFGGCASTENANDNGPLEQADWYAAVAFANARSAAEGLTSCYTLTGCTDAANGWRDGIHSGCTGATFSGLTCPGYRLPTESEWEYAARGGTTTATYLGNLNSSSGCSSVQANLDGIAWWCLNSGGRTQAVGGKASNSLGLYDMLGNVYEWTGDWFGIYPGTATDPTGATTGAYRLGRGGLWSADARNARAAFRWSGPADSRRDQLGFRLARTAP